MVLLEKIGTRLMTDRIVPEVETVYRPVGGEITCHQLTVANPDCGWVEDPEGGSGYWDLYLDMDGRLVGCPAE